MYLRISVLDYINGMIRCLLLTFPYIVSELSLYNRSGHKGGSGCWLAWRKL